MPRIVKAPDERRGELIAAARRLFFSQGFKRTSVTDIVDSIGVAKGLFYYYFDSKLAILEALVDDLTQESLSFVDAIVADESLSARQKWDRAMGSVGNWKLARKDELLALVGILYSDENILLLHKLQEQILRQLAPAFTRIIAQGVDEGIFATPFVDDAARIIFSISLSAQNEIYNIVLYPDRFDDPAALLQRKLAAVEAAIERVLGAAPGSLKLADPDVLAHWVT